MIPLPQFSHRTRNMYRAGTKKARRKMSYISHQTLLWPLVCRGQVPPGVLHFWGQEAYLQLGPVYALGAASAVCSIPVFYNIYASYQSGLDLRVPLARNFGWDMFAEVEDAAWCAELSECLLLVDTQFLSFIFISVMSFLS